MPDQLLARVARLLGGVVLTQGRLGHQVLGQLLIAGATEVELVAATVAVAATSGQQNAVAQIAIRTGIPVVAVRALIRKQERRLDSRLRLLDQREKGAARRKRALREREAALSARAREMEGKEQALARDREALRLEREGASTLSDLNRRLQDELAVLRGDRAAAEKALARLPEPPPPDPDHPAPPPVPSRRSPKSRKRS